MTDAREAVASLDACVVCGADAIRETTPLVPAISGFTCDACGYTWQQTGDL